MNTYYAAIVNHPNQKLDPDNNIPLIQIFHSATERNDWVKAYADNPHVKTIDSKQAIRWLRFTYCQYRNQKIPSRMSRDGVVTKFLRTCCSNPCSTRRESALRRKRSSSISPTPKTMC